MHKLTIDYTDHNGQPSSKKLAFHLNKRASFEDVTIADDMESVRRIFENPETQELTTAEKQLLSNFAQKIVRLSYGEVSADGKRFKQDRETFEAFYETPAYDEFLFSLFSPNPARLFEFLIAVVPSNVMAQVEAENPGLKAEYDQALLEANLPQEPAKVEKLPANPGDLTDEQRARFEAWLANGEKTPE